MISGAGFGGGGGGGPRRTVAAHADRYRSSSASSASASPSPHASAARLERLSPEATVAVSKPNSAPSSSSSFSRPRHVDGATPTAPSTAGATAARGSRRFTAGLLLDVLAARRAGSAMASAPQGARDSMDATSHTARSAESTARSLASTSCLSIASLSAIERAVGRALPLTADANCVRLSQADLAQIRDAETLRFLEDNADFFAAYFTQQQQHRGEGKGGNEGEQNEAGKLASPSLPGAEEGRDDEGSNDEAAHSDAAPSGPRSVGALVDALQEEIDTFLTAVDAGGHSYSIRATNAEGELVVPVDVDVAVPDGDYSDGEEQHVGDGGGLTTEELAAFEAQLDTLRDSHISPYDPEDGDEVRVGVMSSAATSLRPSESDAQLSVADPPIARTKAEGAAPAAAALPGTRLEHGLEQRRRIVVRHAAARREQDQTRPRYALPTATSAQQQQQCDGHLAPSPPRGGGGEADAPPSTSAKAGSFGVVSCGRPTEKVLAAARRGAKKPGPGTRSSKAAAAAAAAAAGAADGVVVVKSARARLSAPEERRVQFILDHDDWDGRVMDVAAAAVDGGSGSTEGRATTEYTSSTAVSSRHGGHRHAFAFDEASVSEYKPADGGYRPAAELANRIAEIDAKLSGFAEARASVTGGRGVAGTPLSLLAKDAAPGSPRPPSAMAGIDADLLRDVAPPPPRGGRKADQLSPPTAAPVALTTEAEEARVAAERRKQIGNAYAAQVREERETRQRLNRINDALAQLARQVDCLHTPPFSLNMHFGGGLDPSQVEWPSVEGVPAPSESELASLLEQARAEAAGGGAEAEEEAPAAGGVGVAASALVTHVAADTERGAAATAFLEILRERAARAQALAAPAAAPHRDAAMLAVDEDAEVEHAADVAELEMLDRYDVPDLPATSAASTLSLLRQQKIALEERTYDLTVPTTPRAIAQLLLAAEGADGDPNM